MRTAEGYRWLSGLCSARERLTSTHAGADISPLQPPGSAEHAAAAERQKALAALLDAGSGDPEQAREHRALQATLLREEDVLRALHGAAALPADRVPSAGGSAR